MRIWAVLLRVLFAVSGMVFSLFIASEAGWGEWIVILVSISGLLLISDSMSLVIRDRVMKRRKLLGRFAVHEIGSFAFTLLVIMPVLGPWWVMGLFILPLLWFMSMNRLLYGNGMVPGFFSMISGSSSTTGPMFSRALRTSFRPIFFMLGHTAVSSLWNILSGTSFSNL